MPFTSWREFRKSGNVIWEETWKETVESPLDRLNQLDEDGLLAIKGIGPKTAEKLLSQLPAANSLDELDISKPALNALNKWLSD